jgi:general secretion pathway protein M
VRAWFESLQPRERIFVFCGSVVVVIGLFYGFIWMPLDKGHRELAASVATWQRSVEELGALKSMPSSDTAGRSASTAQQTPVVIVDQTLRSRGLDRALKRSQPTTGNGIRVEFENVAFDDLVLWLGDLSAQYAMDVTSGTFSSANQTEVGRINATVTLERAP